MKKLYYSIGEVSRMMELESHVLRYWETEFEQLSPRKNRAGHRIYTESDIEIAQRLKQLLKENRYTIDGARRVLCLEMGGDAARGEHRRNLMELRSLLQDMMAQLEAD